jgi:hypothetical protein
VNKKGLACRFAYDLYAFVYSSFVQLTNDLSCNDINPASAKIGTGLIIYIISGKKLIFRSSHSLLIMLK